MKYNILIFIYCLFLISKINSINSKKNSLRKNKNEQNQNSTQDLQLKMLNNIENFLIDINDAAISHLKQELAQFNLKKEQKQVVLKKTNKIIKKLKKLSKEKSLTSKKIEREVKDALQQLPQEISQKILGNKQKFSKLINSQQIKNLINKIQEAQQQLKQNN